MDCHEKVSNLDENSPVQEMPPASGWMINLLIWKTFIKEIKSKSELRYFLEKTV